ncbi:MAG: response regulator [Gemmatimonadaceae bacterium]
MPGSASPPPLPALHRVLIVDDERLIRSVLSRFFSRRGWMVEESADGDDALARIRSAPDGRFTLIISDVMMPGMSGVELYDRLVATHPELRARFILASADMAFPPLVALGERASCPVIAKPFEFRAIEETVHNAMSGVAKDAAAENGAAA